MHQFPLQHSPPSFVQAQYLPPEEMAFVQDRFIFDDTMRASVSAFLTSVRAHPRFRLRFIAIVAASCGCFFNFLTLFLTLFGFRDGDLAILTGCAYIPVSLFMVFRE